MSLVEFFCCVASFAFYARRRSKIILFVIFMSFLATLFGFNAKIKLSFCGMLAHAGYCISIVGGFYIYILVDYFLTMDSEKIAPGDDRVSNTVALLVSSLPFVVLFISGIYTMCICLDIEKELDARKEERRVSTIDKSNHQVN